MYPARLGAAQSPLGLGYCRRVPTPGGVRLCWNPEESPDLVPGPAGDPALAVLALEQVGSGRRWTLWNHGAHPVCLGKTSRVVSGDWPGLAMAKLEGASAAAPFLLGACGDVHPWIATQEDASGMEPLASAAAGLVEALAHAARPAAEGPLAVATRSLDLGGSSLDLAAWRLGPARLVAAPVELFASLGAELRRRLPGVLLLASNANGWTGYWPAEADFAGGGYEIDAARAGGRQPGDGERLVEALVALAQDL
jgi:hypothetical protein